MGGHPPLRFSERIVTKSQVALSDRIHEWVARQYDLIKAAQAHQRQHDLHHMVEFDSMKLYR